jgi:hypothetical protein
MALWPPTVTGTPGHPGQWMRPVNTTQPDQEQLTDLSTVFFGLGVFTANAAFDYSQDHRGWQTSQLGYLGERLFGYALAYYAWLRTEETPAWTNQLDTNPAAYMRQGLRYLHCVQGR